MTFCIDNVRLVPFALSRCESDWVCGELIDSEESVPSYNAKAFCKKLETDLRVLNPEATVRLVPFTLPCGEEVWELSQNVDPTRRLFLVGYWTYVVKKTMPINQFEPECFPADDMFPCNQVNELVNALAVSLLTEGIFTELRKLFPQLKRSSEPSLDLHLLYEPTLGDAARYSGGIPADVKAKYNNNICAWVQRVCYDCYKIGVMGCSGKSFYLVGSELYLSDAEEFNWTKRSTYKEKEAYVHGLDWMMAKLKATSWKWLSPKPTNGKPKPSAKPQHSAKPPANKTPSQGAWRKEDKCPTGPQCAVDDDGFTTLAKKSR